MDDVVVKWIDAYRLGASWTDAAAFKNFDRGLLVHITKGYLAYDSEDIIIVCSSKQEVSNLVTSCMVIPKGIIVSIQVRKENSTET